MRQVFFLKGVVVLLFLATAASAQCPVSSFELPTEACRESNTQLDASASNADLFSWDFCDGSITNTPIAVASQTVSEFFEPYDIKTIEVDNSLYVFVVNYRDGKLLRFDYGNSFENVPTFTDLGNFGVITKPLGIGFHQEGSQYYGLVSNESGQLFRLSFGTSITSTPVVTEITGLSGLTNHRHMRFTREGNDILALVAGGTSSLTILNFGSSVANQPGQITISIPNAIAVIDVDFVNECNSKFVVATSYVNGIHVLNFGSSFLNPTPTITEPTGLGPSNSLSLMLVKSKGNYHAFVSSEPTGFYRIDFGTALDNSTPNKVSLGTFNGLNNTVAHTLTKVGTTYYSISANYSNDQLHVLKFPKDCEYSGSYTGIDKPVISFPDQGTYFVTLTSVSTSSGISHSVTHQLDVSSTITPAISIDNDICADEPVQFTVTESGGGLPTNVSWDFGDGDTGTGQNTTHQFATAGEYLIRVGATTANGCATLVEKDIKLYNAPEALFTAPSGGLCTNNELVFTNNTIDSFEGNLSFQWLIDDVPTSTATDLTVTFESGGSKEIKLQASIPGCVSEDIELMDNIGEGPTVDFDSEGQCEDEVVTFFNRTTGDVSSLTWTFSEGSTSSETDPEMTFGNAGTYTVSLLATNASGCENRKEKLITIYTKPQPNFNIELPPFSCNGTPTHFNDLTPVPPDSNLETWQWDFDDNATSAEIQHPEHTYATAGLYQVTLIVTSDEGCVGSRIKEVTIAQTPAPDIADMTTCVDAGVTLAEISGVIATSWQWQIGNHFYFTENPEHVFEQPGDYDVQLILEAENGCVGSTSKEIHVPQPLDLAFTQEKNCVGTATLFSATVAANPDTPQQYNWAIDGETIDGEQAEYVFDSDGPKEVTLVVQGVSGCTYSLTKSIPVVPTPVAGFRMNTSFGPPPLNVQFTNESMHATSFVWNFNDLAQSTSNDVSPAFSFAAVGNYAIDLTARNVQGCEHTVSQLVTVAFPLVSVALTDFQVVDHADGTRSFLVTLRNNGNMSSASVQIQLTLPDGISFRETLITSLGAGETRTYALNTELGYATIPWICATLHEADNTSSQIESCLTLTDATVVVPPTPNPANDFITLKYIRNSEGITQVEMIDQAGHVALSTTLFGGEGQNSATLDVRQLRPGIYFVRVRAEGSVKTFRTIIHR